MSVVACVASAGVSYADGDAGTFSRLAFDGPPPLCVFSDTTALRDEYADLGVSFSGPAANDGGGVLGTCSSFLVTGISPPTFLGFNAAASFADGGTPRDPETIDFDRPVNFVQAMVGSFIEVGYPATMTAFDGGGDPIGSTTVPLGREASPLLVVAPGISRVEVAAPGARWVLDDLLYGSSPGGDLGVTPVALSQSLEPGASALRTLTVTNGSAHDLQFFVREQPPAVDGAAPAAAFEELGPASAANLELEVEAAVQHRVQRGSSPATPRILVYTEVEPLATTPDSDLDRALRSLDLPYTAVYGGNIPSLFIPALVGDDWDLVIFDHQVAFFYDWDLAVLDELLDHVDGGGRLIMASWQVADRPDHPLWRRLGVDWFADLTEPLPVVWTGAAPRFVSVPNDVPEFRQLEHYYGVDAQRVEAGPGSVVLARFAFDEADGAEAPALILANDGRTLFRSFMDGNNISDRDGDGLLDTVELWRDLVIQMLAEDVPWLTVAAEGTVPAGGELAMDVGFDAAGLAPGSHGASLLLRSNEAVESTYRVDVVLEVVAAVLFADGFESGDTSAWAAVEP